MAKKKKHHRKSHKSRKGAKLKKNRKGQVPLTLLKKRLAKLSRIVASRS